MTAPFASIAFEIAPLAIAVALPTLVTGPVRFAFVVTVSAFPVRFPKNPAAPEAVMFPVDVIPTQKICPFASIDTPGYPNFGVMVPVTVKFPPVPVPLPPVIVTTPPPLCTMSLPLACDVILQLMR